MAFERAEATEDVNERAALLTFLIVGGGPTGVELAGAIAELARFGMDKEFRRFDPASARVILVQSGPRILPSFPESLSTVAHRSLTRLGVEVLLDSRVDGIDAEGVSVSGKRIAARTVLWAAGVMASKAAQWLGVPADNAGRVKVDQHLNAEGQSSVWVIGDTAASNAWAGKPVPGLAPAAKQGGQYVAGVIRAPGRGTCAAGAVSRTGIWEASRPSAANRRWRILVGSRSGARRPGGCGGSFTWDFWWAAQSRGHHGELVLGVPHLRRRHPLDHGCGVDSSRLA